MLRTIVSTPLRPIKAMVLLLIVFSIQTAAAQTVTLNVGAVYASQYYTGVSAIGPVQMARFTGAPFVQKVNSTLELLVGNMTYGGNVTGHASIVFQYFPTTNVINVPPGTSHITTTWGTQVCRVYENGGWNCGVNPNWQICGGTLPGYPAALANLAAINRAQAIAALTASGLTVTQTAVTASALNAVVPGFSKAAKVSTSQSTMPGFVGFPGPKK